MISYRDFKEAVAEPIFHDIEKQIDDLFDELKRKLRNPNTPRSGVDISQDWKQWLLYDKYRKSKLGESNKLTIYHALNKLSQEFREALTTEEDLDAVLDKYRNRLKQLVRVLISQSEIPAVTPTTTTPTAPTSTTIITPTATVRTPTIRTPTIPTTPTTPATTTPTTTTTPTGVTTPEKPIRKRGRPPKSAATKPKPKLEPLPPPEPTPLPGTKPELPEPEPEPEPTQPAQKELSDEEKKLMQVGAAVAFLRDRSGEQNVSPDDVKIAIRNVPFEPNDNISEKDYYIKIAKEYLQSQTAKSEPAPSSPGETTHPTREDLQAMTPKQFRAWMLEHDPELAGSFAGEKWWSHKMRDDLIDSYLRMKEQEHKANKTESLQYKVNKYKEMLRQTNRPEILLHEAAKIPMPDRVSYYKKKLRSFSSK